jgi:integrase
MAGTDPCLPSSLSDMTLTAAVRRMKVAAVPHGFRSTFRDWASERTNYPRDVAEMALAHAIGEGWRLPIVAAICSRRLQIRHAVTLSEEAYSGHQSH